MGDRAPHTDNRYPRTNQWPDLCPTILWRCRRFRRVGAAQRLRLELLVLGEQRVVLLFEGGELDGGLVGLIAASDPFASAGSISENA